MPDVFLVLSCPVCDESLGARILSHKPHEASKDALKKVTKQIREDGQFLFS